MTWPTGTEMFPHYFSTYCIHELHEDCRLVCKHCTEQCRCPCHQEDDGADP